MDGQLRREARSLRHPRRILAHCRTLFAAAFGAAAVPVTVDCPQCDTSFPFHGPSNPRFDSSGFECCKLKSAHCGVSLAGVIDPYDDTLLLSPA
jgi:hypothetical protein